MSDVNDWIWLFIACPASGCSNNNETYWSHCNCPKNNLDHDIRINSSGYCKCNAWLYCSIN